MNILIVPSQYEHINRQIVGRLMELRIAEGINTLNNCSADIIVCQDNVEKCYLNYCLNYQDSLSEGEIFDNNTEICKICINNQMSVATQLKSLGADVRLIELDKNGNSIEIRTILSTLTREYITRFQFVADSEVYQELNNYIWDKNTISSEELLHGMRSVHSIITSLSGQSVLTNKEKSLYLSKIQSWVKTLVQIKLKLKMINKYNRCFIFNGRFEVGSTVSLVCEENSIDYYCFESGHQFGPNAITSFMTKNAQIQDLKARGEYLYEFYNRERIDTKRAKQWGNEWLNSRINKLVPTGTYRQFIDNTFNTRHQMHSNYDLFLTTSQYEYTGCKGYRPGEAGYEMSTLIKLGKIETSRMLLIRLHPNSLDCDDRYFKLLKHELSLHAQRPITIINPEEKINTYDLIRNSLITFVSSSIAAIEAVFLGKPTFVTCWATYSSTVKYLNPNRFWRYKEISCSTLTEMQKDIPSKEAKDQTSLYAYQYNFPCQMNKEVIQELANNNVPDLRSYHGYGHYNHLLKIR